MTSLSKICLTKCSIILKFSKTKFYLHKVSELSEKSPLIFYACLLTLSHSVLELLRDCILLKKMVKYFTQLLHGYTLQTGKKIKLTTPNTHYCKVKL